jgi:hypothetical protein
MIARATALAILLGALAACVSQPPSSPGLHLSAALTSPNDIALTWEGAESGAAGRIVEFATEPNGPYTILEFVPPSRNTFSHPDLMPETPFYYRVRPFSGPASPWVDVALPAGEPTEEDQRADHSWAAPRTLPGGPAATSSTRTPAAQPSNVTATVKHANGIAFTWTDNAADEEGYLIEVKPNGSEDLRVAAIADPNVNAYGLITLPDEKVAAYRVRAFYYGQSSNVVNLRTGR